MGILATTFPPSQARSAAFATFGAGVPIGEGGYDSGPKRGLTHILVGKPGSVFGTTIGAGAVELTG